MGNYVKKKKEMVFQSVDSLQQVVNVVNEAAMAVNDKTRTIGHSAIPEVLTGALGAGIGGVRSFLALYGLGTVGLSAAGITSGLAAAGEYIYHPSGRRRPFRDTAEAALYDSAARFPSRHGGNRLCERGSGRDERVL